MLELLPKDGENYEEEKIMSAEEIIRIIREGKVVAPVGCKTFLAVWVDANGRLDMAGTADPNALIRIAYEFQKQVFEPRMEAKDESGDS